MRRLLFLSLAWAALSPSGHAAAGKPDAAAVRDEDALRAAGLKADDASLLEFFRSRTLAPAQQERFRALVKQLASPSYHQRSKATVALIKMGPPVKALLQAVKDRAPDDETARRAELCLRKLGPGGMPRHAALVARVIGRRKPVGAADVLVGYLPFAAEESVIQEVRVALAAMAAPGGEPEPVLVKALETGEPLQRAAAAEALCRAQVQGLDAQIFKALAEFDPRLRLRVALALLEVHRGEALPVLIDLVRDLPARDAWQAEGALRRVAGEDAPRLAVDRDTPGPKVRDAWRAWYARQGKGLDLAKLDLSPRLLGYTLLCQMDQRGTTGRVMEMGPDKAVKWEIGGLRYPVDAQVIRPDRVLIAEYLNRRVSERDFKGNIIWEKQVDLPIACERLPNGNTFVATRRQLVVYDTDGKEVFTYHHPATSISAGRRLPDGRMLVVSGGQCVLLDTSGKAVKTFHVGTVYTLGGNIDVLPGGRVLVPEYSQNRVAEYDLDGKLLWQAHVRFPISAVRLANGNTLVVSMTERKVVELNREGREVWSHAAEGRLWRARKR
jgi:HEAT repeat protein